MKPLSIFLLLAPAMLLATAALAQEIRWHENYSEAMEEARRTNKPLLVSFRCVP